MTNLRKRFTLWYIRRGYTFRTVEGEGVWDCPWWVRPMLLAALEVDGVSGLAGATAAEQFLGRKKLSKGISILWESDNITIDVSIQIKYGVIVPEVAKKVQEAIIANVEGTSGMQVAAVNVRVSGVTFEKPAAE